MPEYSREQIYDAMRKADAAGDAEAVKALAEALKAGATKPEIQAIAAEKGLQVDEAALDANIASRDAGGPVNQFVEPERPSLMEQLKTSGQNALAGAAQGAAGVYDFPMELATQTQRGVNALLGYGGGALMDAVGAEGAADWWRRGVALEENRLSNAPTAAGAIEQISPTPEGQEAARLASQIVGGMMVPLGPKTPKPAKAPNVAASEAEQIVRAGQREGVRVMTSDVRPPKSFMGKLARATGERIPLAGTGGVRVKQNEERIAAVKQLAEDYGIEGGQELIDEVASDLAKTRGGRITALANRKNAVIDGIQGAVDTPRAVKEIDAQIARLKGINDAKLGPVIRELGKFRNALTSGKSLREIEENRKLLGAMFEDQNLASVKDVGQKAINSIYGPLREDMGVFISRNGTKEAYQRWVKANDELAAMAGELDAGTFKRVLQNAETTPENVASILFSKKPSEVRRLYANLSPAGKEKARAAVLHEAITKAGGIDEVSPQRFANALKAFGKTTGIIFGDDAPRIEGIVRLLRATQQASVAAAAPPTGVQNAPVIGAAVLTDWLGGLGGATTAAGLAGGAARLYESAPVRNMLVGLSKTKPGSAAESKVMERIAKVLASQTEIQSANLPAAANMNTAARLVAEDGNSVDQRK